MALITDTLFVAMTRPTMKWGVPWKGLIANGLISGSITVFIIHRPPGFAIAILIHVLMRELCRVDPQFFWKWAAWLSTKAKSTTGVVWGGSRLQPSPSFVRNASEMKSHV